MNVSKKVVNTNWRNFAERIVEKAGIMDEGMFISLVDAFAAVPRDQFVIEGFEALAAEDEALPIGYGQTISRPSTVARMLDLLGVQKGMRVLEVGCGSGYASAVMAAIGANVFAIESVGLLAQRTRAKLDGLNFQNIIVRRGDGRKGWSEHASYDAILVSTAFEKIDSELLEQLESPGGRLVAPIGDKSQQTLYLWEAKSGGYNKYQLEPCKFVEGQSSNVRAP